MLMSLPKRRTLTTASPLTTKEIDTFRENVEIGESVPSIVGIKRWTSSTNFEIIPVKDTVTILHKYPHLVETDKGIMTWKAMVVGYHGSFFSAKEPVEAPAPKARKKAA